MFAGLAVAGALVVVGQRNPTYSAFALIVTLVSLSAVFGLLGSPFIAVLQVVVYAGAIMVLFLFVAHAAQRQDGGSAWRAEGRVFKLVALALGAVLLAEVGSVLVASTPADVGPASTPPPAPWPASSSRSATCTCSRPRRS